MHYQYRRRRDYYRYHGNVTAAAATAATLLQNFFPYRPAPLMGGWAVKAENLVTMVTVNAMA